MTRAAWLMLIAACGGGADAAPRDAAVDSEVDSTLHDAQMQEDALLSCKTRQYVLAAPSLELLILLDRSWSMKQHASWEAATSAIAAFADGPHPADLQLALSAFPTPLLSENCFDESYSANLVPMQPATGFATQFKEAVERHGCGGADNPLHAALVGSLGALRARHVLDPLPLRALVLISDGMAPRECELTLDEAPGVLGAQSRRVPTFPTFVVALEGSERKKLNALAEAGGSGQAFQVQAGPGARGEIAAALSVARDAALACVFRLPEAPNAAQSSVRLGADESSAVQHTEQCTDDGEGFTIDASGQRLTLCPASCERAQTAGTRPVLELGCP